ncbi:hypothetical protein PCASD_17902 [Puccinia coronata f. sp. avenae]|uniref:Restriction of telomere capping protein 4 n=1 Tax=Puccinia coronata f. sp. avenae TaxID=200324 RepID=A0A2N5U939_9BASI|nr:hypothetical protein PCASD_17902 [Puccinia coronata f. sp. avenae]
MHWEELNIIPHGLAQGWPSILDFANLPRRVKNLCNHLLAICDKRITSSYLDQAVHTWITIGRNKSQSLFYDMSSFDTEQPGYYGVQGFQIIYNTLHYMFLSTTTIDYTTQLACPILADYLVQKVLIPETALSLIAEDFNTHRLNPLVQNTLNESRAYGAAMFPDEASSL